MARTSHEFVAGLGPVTEAKTCRSERGFAMNKRVLVRDLPASFGRAMFRLAAVCMLALWCFAGAHAATPAQGWRIDEEHTWIGFKIDAVGFPPTRGHFTRYSGRILIDFDRPAKSFTTFTVETASVDVGSGPFDDFVKSAALLNAEKFPIVSFTSTQVEKLDARTARVTGPLTMLGVSDYAHSQCRNRCRG